MPDPFLQLVPNRVESALRRLRDEVWSDRVATAVTAVAPTPVHRSLSAVLRVARKPVRIGAAWGRLYDQRWFHVALPAATRRGAPRYFEWRDQGEATLHVDGVPYYGFDVAHRYVALPPGVHELWIEGYCCQSAIWHPDVTGLSAQGSVFSGAFLTRRNDLAWSALHDLQCLADVMMQLRSSQNPTPPRELSRFGQQPSIEQATPAYRILLSRLSGAIDAYDTSGPEGLQRALAAVFREFSERR
jgi:alpha-mannosidase